MLCPWSGPFHATIMALLIITFKSGDLLAGYKWPRTKIVINLGTFTGWWLQNTHGDFRHAEGR